MPDLRGEWVRYEATSELAPGWVHAARIRTPSTTFTSAISERRPSDRQPIRFYKPPDLPLHLEYHVVLGDSAAQQAIVPVTDAITLGQMKLTSGKRVLIIATFWEIDEDTQRVIDLVNENAAKGAPGNAGFVSGIADGIAIFLDLASVKPAQ